MTKAYQPSDHLNALARLPTLRSLTLYSAINITTNESTIDSSQESLQINKTTARDLFLRLRSAKHGRPLQKLQINLGEWGHTRYKLRGECLHPLDERCGNLFTCEMEPVTGEVVVTDGREEMMATLTEEEISSFRQLE